MGFMGAGKSTLGKQLAERIGRPFLDLDEEVVRRTETPIEQLFEAWGEPEFRSIEESVAAELLGREAPSVISLGGGAVLSASTRAALERTTTLHVEVDAETAWERAASSGRPLAASHESFLALYEERRPVYDEVADARVTNLDDAVLASAGITVGSAVVEGHVAADPVPARMHGVMATHEVTGKSLHDLQKLWSELRLDRAGTLVAFGGGTTTDLVGFAAATYMRGIDWVAVPTTLVGQVDAAIGGKTAIDLPEAKNLVGAFHWPSKTVINAGFLRTLPEQERRNGMAEVVKAGLLAGEPFWELPEPELVRRCAAFKAAVCLRDPHERSERAILNLGHTFGHALETASEYRVAHGEAVALGLLAALRLSGQDTAIVEEVLAPTPVKVDRGRAWEALTRDKKGRAGKPRLVLLEAPGKPRYGVELPEAEVRAALDSLIA